MGILTKLAPTAIEGDDADDSFQTFPTAQQSFWDANESMEVEW